MRPGLYYGPRQDVLIQWDYDKGPLGVCWCGVLFGRTLGTPMTSERFSLKVKAMSLVYIGEV